MTPNHKLTNVIKGRIIEDLQMNPAEVFMRFFDGSSMRVKVMESNSPPLKNGARIRAVVEQSVTFIVSCEDESQIVLTLADPGSSVTVRDADGKIEYLGAQSFRKTPVWSREDAKTLLDSIPKDSVSGLRDRALIAAMLYSFARVSAVLKVRFDDYYHNGARRRLRLHEKGGKEHEMPVHHLLEQILDEYIVAAGLQSGQPLFQSLNSLGTAVTGRALNRYNAWAAIRKRAKAAGFLTPVGCHTWRATGITIYLENDGRLEHAQQMAGHESPRTTKLYDRTKDEITLSEVERIRL